VVKDCYDILVTKGLIKVNISKEDSKDLLRQLRKMQGMTKVHKHKISKGYELCFVAPDRWKQIMGIKLKSND